MSDKGLINLARNDLFIAKILITTSNDELMINTCAYHTQQAIEKSLKYAINMGGLDYPREHRIELLVDFCEQNNIEYPIWLKGLSYHISDWATKTRYNSNFKVIRDTLVEVMEQTEDWIESLE